MKPALKLDGKRVFLAGELAWYTQNEVRAMIVSEGGEISSELSEQCDFVIVGADAGKTPAAAIEAERLNEGGAKIAVMPEPDFVSFCLPEREEIIGLLRTGAVERLKAFTDLAHKLSRTSEPWFDLSGVNLSGLDLEGFEFGELRLEGSSFEKARLRNCRFSSFNAVRLNFKDAHFAHVRLPQLDQCQCSGAIFKQMYFHDCSYSKLIDCQFDRVIFAEIEPGYATLTVASNFSNASFLDCVLDYARFGYCDLSSTSWTGCELLNVLFSDCELPMSVFKDAWLISVKFKNADLTGADFRNANLALSDLREAKIDGADFTGCNLAGAKVEGLNPDHATGFKEALEESSTGAGSSQGSAITELDECARQAKSFEITFEIERAGKTTLVGIMRSPSNVYVHLRFKRTMDMGTGEASSDRFNIMTSSLLQESLADAICQATRIFRGLRPRVESINAKLTKGNVTSKQFRTLAIHALREAFGIEAPEDQKSKR